MHGLRLTDLDVRRTALRPSALFAKVALPGITAATPDETYPEGFGDTADPYSEADAILVIEFTTAANITAEQIIWEVGGAGIGAALVLEAGNLDFYGFSGSTTPLFSVSGMAGNQSYSVAVAIDFTNDEVRLYRALGAIATETDLEHTQTGVTDTDWAGGSETSVGEGGSVQGGASGDFQGTIDSDLRLYATNDMTLTYVA